MLKKKQNNQNQTTPKTQPSSAAPWHRGRAGREAAASGLQRALLILSNETLLPVCLHVCRDK